MRVLERSAISSEPNAAQFWFVEVSYLDGPTETYASPVKIVSDDKAQSIAPSWPHAVIARFSDDHDSILFDAVWDTDFREKLFRLMLDRQHASGRNGNLVGALSPRVGAVTTVLPSNVLSGEQSNSSLLFADKFFLKLYRKLEDGVNPDVEVTRFLTERAQFDNVPAFGGSIEYRRAKTQPTVVCLLQDAITSESDAWTMTLDHVGRFYERVLCRKRSCKMKPRRLARWSKNWSVGFTPRKQNCSRNAPANCISRSPQSGTIPYSRRNRSTPWPSALFIKACARSCAAISNR